MSSQTETGFDKGIVEKAAGQGSSGAAGGLSEEEVFDILNNERRRQTIRYLRRAESTTDLGELCEFVASRENEIPPEQVESDQRKRVYTALKQSHLPKMERAGVIEFDDRDNDIQLTDQADDLDLYLEVVPDDDIPWSSYYLGLSGIFSLFAVPLAFDAYPFVLLPEAAWLGVMAALLFGSALVHRLQTGEMRLDSDGGPGEV